jgi:hypothetical protein
MFQKHIGTMNQEFRAESGLQTADGGYVLLGNKVTPNSTDIYFVRTDAFGDVIWANTFGGSDIDQGQSVKQTNDGGFIIAGNTQSFGLGNPHVYLLRTDANGTLLWSKTYSGTGGALGYDVLEDANGNFLVTGGAGGDLYLLKTDASGNLIWAKVCDGTGLDIGYCIQPTNDGGYIISGNNQVGGLGTGDVFLVKTDSSFNLQWSKRFSSPGQDDGNSVLQTNDGGYIIGATTTGFGAGGADAWVLRTDSAGTLLWSKTFGGITYDWIHDIYAVSTGGFITIGQTNSFGAGNYDMYFIRLDANGDSLWTRAYGDFALDEGQCISETTDGGFMGLGGSIPPGAGDMFLVKTDAMGNSLCNQSGTASVISIPAVVESIPTTIIFSVTSSTTTPPTTVTAGGTSTTVCTNVGAAEFSINNPIMVYPNPSEGKFTVELPGQQGEGWVEVYNSKGTVIHKQKINASSTIINVNAAEGIYAIRISSDGVVWNHKIMLVH